VEGAEPDESAWRTRREAAGGGCDGRESAEADAGRRRQWLAPWLGFRSSAANSPSRCVTCVAPVFFLSILTFLINK
jgi:hypothetical protein